MNKTVKKVFLVIGILVAAFLIWQLFFNDGGVLITGYNAVAGVINNVWAAIVGDANAKIIPTWGDAVDKNGNDGLGGSMF